MENSNPKNVIQLVTKCRRTLDEIKGGNHHFHLDAHPHHPWIAFVAEGPSLQVWNHEEGVLVASTDGLPSTWDPGWMAARFVPQEEWVVACNFFGCSILVFEMQTSIFRLKHVKELAHEGGPIFDLIVHPRLPYLLFSHNKNIKLWDWDHEWLRITFRGHSDNVTALAFNQLRPMIFTSGSRDGTIKVWNIESGSVIKTMHALDGIHSVQFCSKHPKSILVTGDLHGNICVWDYKKGSVIACWTGHDNPEALISGVSLHPCLPLIFAAFTDGTIRVWNEDNHELAYSHSTGLEDICMMVRCGESRRFALGGVGSFLIVEVVIQAEKGEKGELAEEKMGGGVGGGGRGGGEAGRQKDKEDEEQGEGVGVGREAQEEETGRGLGEDSVGEGDALEGRGKQKEEGEGDRDVEKAQQEETGKRLSEYKVGERDGRGGKQKKKEDGGGEGEDNVGEGDGGEGKQKDKELQGEEEGEEEEEEDKVGQGDGGRGKHKDKEGGEEREGERNVGGGKQKDEEGGEEEVEGRVIQAQEEEEQQVEGGETGVGGEKRREKGRGGGKEGDAAGRGGGNEEEEEKEERGLDLRLIPFKGTSKGENEQHMKSSGLSESASILMERKDKTGSKAGASNCEFWEEVEIEVMKVRLECKRMLHESSENSKRRERAHLDRIQQLEAEQVALIEELKQSKLRIEELERRLA